MAIKNYKPTTNGRRGMTTLANDEITTRTPEKSLVVSKTKTGGRNNQGKMTVRHIGGGAKQEYDPNRNVRISLVFYADGEKRYIIAPKDLKVGSIIEAGENADIKIGNALPLMNIPVGTTIHCIELQPGKGAALCRAAGTSAQILGREDKYVLIRLQSGETRKVLGTCMATIGVVGNEDYELVNWGKAGRTRHLGVRPTNRGSVMNPNDHPHGGGEGRTPVGRKAPMTPWGKKAMGVKTRSSKKKSSKLIVSRKKK